MSASYSTVGVLKEISDEWWLSMCSLKAAFARIISTLYERERSSSSSYKLSLLVVFLSSFASLLKTRFVSASVLFNSLLSSLLVSRLCPTLNSALLCSVRGSGLHSPLCSIRFSALPLCLGYASHSICETFTLLKHTIYFQISYII